MTVFVILHYRDAARTLECVRHIEALEGDNRTVVVDNASPDGSGLELLRRLGGDRRVTVILNRENAGFARGNNLGVSYACRCFSPDFAVVLNNDVEIQQPDFSLRIEDIYGSAPFDILGPDIISLSTGVHQSPKSLRGCDLESVRRKAAYVRRSQSPILMYLSSGEKSSALIWGHVQRRRRQKSGIDFAAPAEGAVLHGSCVIFSRRYLDAHPQPFYPGTFMYYEMEILDWLCRRDGSVVRYDPSLRVLHYQNAATHLEYRSIVKQSKFVAACLLDSLNAAEDLMLRAGETPARLAAEQPSPMLAASK